MFLAMTKVNKQNGLGDIVSYPPIEDADMRKISDYFKQKMYSNPDPKVLTQIYVCNIIYYLCRQGRENLHQMTINTFSFDHDPETNLRFIYQGQMKLTKITPEVTQILQTKDVSLLCQVNP